MSEFEKKGIYHSALVKATKDQPLSVLVTGEPQQSKYKDKPAYVGLKIDGKEHFLYLENDAIFERFKGLKGSVVELTATGTRDDAEITFHVAAKKGMPEKPKPAPAGNGSKFTPMGVTVGMAINNAVKIITDYDQPSFDYYKSADFSKDLHVISSDILRVATMLEHGKLAEPVKDRKPPEPKPEPEPQEELRHPSPEELEGMPDIPF